MRPLDLGQRIPPHDGDAEAAVLSAMLASGAAFDDARSTGILADDFYGDANRRMFAAACHVADTGQPVDIATVAARLREQDQLNAIGGISTLAHVVNATPAVANVAAHANIVRELARRRAFCDALSYAQGEAWTRKGSTSEVIAAAMSRLDFVADHGAPKLTQAVDAVAARLQSLNEQWQGKRVAGGIPSVLPGLNGLLGGYRLSAASVLAGSTGGGKSSAGLQEVLGVAGTEYNGETVGALVVSLEMDCDENIDRALAIESGIHDQRIQVGALNDDEFEVLQAAAARIEKKPIWFETSEVDIHGIRAAWRKADRELRKNSENGRVRFVVVDFLGLVRLENAERHDIALSNLTRGLKMLAMAENIHVMALCQFNRASTLKDPWDEPTLSDLKDSSGIEQNANQVIFVHRVDMPGAETYAGLCVRKNRKGEKGTRPSKFNGACYRFEPVTSGDMDRWDQLKKAPRAQRRRR